MFRQALSRFGIHPRIAFDGRATPAVSMWHSSHIIDTASDLARLSQGSD